MCMKRDNGIVWFRNDLRVTDNRVLHLAQQECKQLLPVFILDPRWFQPTDLGFEKTGHFRLAFLLQSLQNLKKKLSSLDGDLWVVKGYPEVILPELTQKFEIDKFYASKEITWEEVKVEEALEYRLKELSVPLHYEWQHTLLHPDDIPFDFSEIPDVFSSFRKKNEKETIIRETVPVPGKISVPAHLDFPTLPTMGEMGYEQPAKMRYTGGEDEAWRRLNDYFWKKDLLKNYKFTRNGLLGEDYSSKFSPWLANGCISPRSIHQQVKQYEKERKSNISTYWLIFELYWRDYFRYIAAKYGNQLFFKTGLQNKSVDLNDDFDLFQQWASGNTGIPFIDANMKELNQTGFMSNRGRQNVASFLVKDLQVNWTWGAAYFESQLIDYDVTSNWGNWAYVAGVGNDPRQNRYFNIMKQAQQYDPKGEFVRYWLPQLKHLENAYVHSPALLPAEQLQKAGIKIGDNYPKNLVPFRKWLK